MKILARRSIEDSEKAVLPAIIWTTKAAGGLRAYALSLGWWDWHLTVLWSRRLTKAGK